MEIYKKDNKLVLEIPLYQKENNCYEEEENLQYVPNLVGVDNGDGDYYISQSIDMSYCGKAPQEGSPIIHTDDMEEFERVCELFGLSVITHIKCHKCGKTIYGSFTIDKDGHYICCDF